MYTKPEYNAVSFDEARLQLIQLWHNAFGDEKAYIERFFALMHAEETLHTLSLGGHVVSALYALPYRMLHDGVEHRVAYIYAVATDADCRGQGFMPLLMRHVHAALAGGGYAASLLVPAAPWLHEYYRDMGYRHCAYRRCTMFTPSNEPPCRRTTIQRTRDAECIARFMEQHTCRLKTALLHPRTSIAMNIYNCEQAGGAVYSATDDGGGTVGTAFVTVEDGRPILTNVTCDDKSVENTLIKRVCNDFTTDRVLRVDADDENGTPFGMMLRFAPNTPETLPMTLMLDK